MKINKKYKFKIDDVLPICLSIDDGTRYFQINLAGFSEKEMGFGYLPFLHFLFQDKKAAKVFQRKIWKVMKMWVKEFDK